MHLQCKLFNTPIKCRDSLVCIYASGPHILVTLRGPPLFPIPSPAVSCLLNLFHRTVLGREDNEPHSLELLFGRKSWLSAWGEKGKEQIEFILTQCSHAFSMSTFRTVFNNEGLHRKHSLNLYIKHSWSKFSKFIVCICIAAQLKFKFAVYVVKYISKCLLMN